MANAVERLTAEREIAANGCWIWTGSRTGPGYGQLQHNGRRWLAHRLAFETFVGPIPAGLVIDHLCRTRACINPEHLEPVTHRENILRGDTFLAVNAAKTHCPQGHPLDRVRTRPDGRLRRFCGECKRRQDPPAPRPCAFCGAVIPSTMRRHAVYCSRKCKDRAKHAGRAA